MYKLKLFFVSLIVLLSLTSNATSILNNETPQFCEDINLEQNKTLKNGWYLWEPYQYNQLSDGGLRLTGMDVELVRSLALKVGVSMMYEQLGWDVHQRQLESGNKDIAAGATYTDNRAQYAYFSVPYRFEENSLFMRQDSEKTLSFDSVAEYLAQVRLQNFVLGVTRGFIYADSQINLFIKDPANRDIIYEFDNDAQALEALLSSDIDGFMADRVVGAAVILHKKGAVPIKEVPLNVKTPIHLMFSKKTVPLNIVDKFNKEIKEFVTSQDYKKIVKTYLYPVMLLQTIDSRWFYIIGVIGTIAYAVSGVAIAARDNTTLFGTFLFAMLPSVGGGIMRDVLVNRKEVGIFLTPSYMYYILIVVLMGFSTVRLLEYYNQKANEDSLMHKFWDNILVIGDAIGQAAFIVTGVSIAIMARIEPIELWGPFFAFLTANGGGILRDLMRKNREIMCLSDTINAEIAIIWGLIFSIYLNVTSYDPHPDGIRNAVVIVVVCAFLTRMITHYYNIPNIKFRSEAVSKEEK